MHTDNTEPGPAKRSLACAPSPPRKKTKTMPPSSSSSSSSKAIGQLPETDLKDKLTTVMTIITRGATRNKPVRAVTLHIGMLKDKAPYLYRLALTHPTAEIKLLDLDSLSFGTFAAWLYSGKVAFDTATAGGGGDAGDILPSVLECYVLAQTLQAPDFAYAVVARACAVSAERGLVFRNGVVNEMYKRTAPGCELRRWMVDEWVWQYDNEGVGELEWESECELCNGFLFDVVVAQAGTIGKKAKKHQSPDKMVEKYREQ